MLFVRGRHIASSLTRDIPSHVLIIIASLQNLIPSSLSVDMGLTVWEVVITKVTCVAFTLLKWKSIFIDELNGKNQFNSAQLSPWIKGTECGLCALTAIPTDCEDLMMHFVWSVKKYTGSSKNRRYLYNIMQMISQGKLDWQHWLSYRLSA